MTNEYFIGRIGTILQDHDPIPLYGLKLLQTYIERNKDCVHTLIENGILLQILSLFETLQNDTRSSALVSIVNIIACIVSTTNKDLRLLCRQGLVDYLMSAFIAASSVLEDDETGESASVLFLPLLDTLRQLLKSLEVQAKRIVRFSETAGKLKTGRSQESLNVEQLLQKCKSLTGLNGVLITLQCFDDEDVQDWACHCLYMSAELFGGEYDKTFSEDDLECLTDAIQLSNDKRKKILLKVVRRLVTSNQSLLRVLQRRGDELRQYLSEIVADNKTTTPEQEAVKIAANEVLALMKEYE